MQYRFHEVLPPSRLLQAMWAAPILSLAVHTAAPPSAEGKWGGALVRSFRLGPPGICRGWAPLFPSCDSTPREYGLSLEVACQPPPTSTPPKPSRSLPPPSNHKMSSLP